MKNKKFSLQEQIDKVIAEYMLIMRTGHNYLDSSRPLFDKEYPIDKLFATKIKKRLNKFAAGKLLDLVTENPGSKACDCFQNTMARNLMELKKEIAARQNDIVSRKKAHDKKKSVKVVIGERAIKENW